MCYNVITTKQQTHRGACTVNSIFFINRKSDPLPRPFLIGCVLHARLLQPSHHPVQGAAPHGLEPVGAAKPPDNSGADGVVGTNEGYAENVLCQGIIPKAPQNSNSFFEV